MNSGIVTVNAVSFDGAVRVADRNVRRDNKLTSEHSVTFCIKSFYQVGDTTISYTFEWTTDPDPLDTLASEAQRLKLGYSDGGKQ